MPEPNKFLIVAEPADLTELAHECLPPDLQRDGVVLRVIVHPSHLKIRDAVNRLLDGPD